MFGKKKKETKQKPAKLVDIFFSSFFWMTMA